MREIVKYKYDENGELLIELESLYTELDLLNEKTSIGYKFSILGVISNTLSSGFRRYQWTDYLTKEEYTRLTKEYYYDKMEAILEEIEKQENKQKINEERMIKTFEIEDLKFDVRIIKRDDIIWFCLKDVCEILEIENSRDVKKD